MILWYLIEMKGHVLEQCVYEELCVDHPNPNMENDTTASKYVSY